MGQPGEQRNLVVIERQPRRRRGDLGHAIHERGDAARLEVTRREGADGRGAKVLRLRCERARVGEAVRADMDDDLQVRAACDLGPSRGQELAFLQGQRAAFAGGAADEGELHAVGEQVRALFPNHIEMERAVGVKRRVRGGDQAAQGSRAFQDHDALGGTPASAVRGRMSSTSTTEMTAAPAKALKMTLSGMFASRIAPKPQSANPPQLMLTRFMTP